MFRCRRNVNMDAGASLYMTRIVGGLSCGRIRLPLWGMLNSSHKRRPSFSGVDHEQVRGQRVKAMLLHLLL